MKKLKFVKKKQRKKSYWQQTFEKVKKEIILAFDEEEKFSEFQFFLIFSDFLKL